LIKLKQVEQVEFTPYFEEIAKAFLKRKSELMRDNARFHEVDLSGEIDKIKFYLTDPGWQVFLTRMKQLPYKSFTAIRSLDVNYLKALTHDLIVTVPSRSGRGRSEIQPGKYNIGQYAIYISYADLVVGNIDDVHFIPERVKVLSQYDDVHYRHMHHYGCLHDRNGNTHIDALRSNPLAYSTSTCWGNFGPIVRMNMAAADIPELYRALYLFTTIQNVDSPLVNPRLLKHYERIHDHD
jgi:hypothetical protein